MKTDGLFTVHSFVVPVKKSGEEIRLVLFGDVHRDSPNHADGEWQSFLSYARKLKDAWFLGLGDYVDSGSTSERECLVKAGIHLHESTKNDINQIAASKVKLLADELSFMRGRLIGLVNGNHYWHFPDGTNTDNKLCSELQCKYLGVSSFIRLTLDYCGRKRTLDLWVHHGAGASRLQGGSINRVDQMREHAEADIYVMGHDHKRLVVPATPRMYLDRRTGHTLQLRSRQQWLIRSGSFLRSYTDGERSYNVDAARGPCSLGHVELLIEFRQSKKDGDSLHIRGLT